MLDGVILSMLVFQVVHSLQPRSTNSILEIRSTKPVYKNLSASEEYPWVWRLVDLGHDVPTS